MKLTPEQEGALDRLRVAASHLEGAGEALRTAVFDALTAGVPVARIAEAAGLARTTILRWLKAESSDA